MLEEGMPQLHATSLRSTMSTCQHCLTRPSSNSTESHPKDEPIMATDLKTNSTERIGEINKYDFRTESQAVFKARKGLDAEIVNQISEMKDEPDWMRDFRLRSLEIFQSKPMPNWGGDIDIDFQDIYYYLKPTDQQGRTWDDVPQEIKETFDKLGIPEAEKKFLAGVKAQFESEVVYGSLKEDLAEKGVIFTDTDTAVREHPDLLREYFGTIIPPADNKFAALNSAVWSGGSFIYVPPGVKIDFPLQAYFRINAESMGQFERTLIIVDEGAQVHYVEGCTAPMYSTESLHSAVVEIIVKRGARCRYTTIQNWANNIYNLVTKRAVAYQDATMEWVDGNLGSRLTMKYPAVYMMEPGARGEILSIAFASAGQHQDAGAKLVHCAPAYHRPDHLQVDFQERRPQQLPRAGQGRKGCQALAVQRGLRRPDPGSRRAAATPTPTSRSPNRMSRSATRRASRGSAKSSCST